MVESTGLENRQRGNSFLGSNPSPSANFLTFMLEIHAHLNWYLYENTKILFDEFWRLVSRGLENEDILIKYDCFNKDNEILNLIQKSQLGLGQICGTTFKKIENLEIEYLGSFVNDDQIKEGYYRSMIVARKGINIKETELRAAINQ